MLERGSASTRFSAVLPGTHLHRTCDALQAVSPRRACGPRSPRRGNGVQVCAGVQRHTVPVSFQEGKCAPVPGMWAAR